MKKRELKYMTEKGWVLEQKYFLYKSFLNLVVQVPAHFFNVFSTSTFEKH